MSSDKSKEPQSTSRKNSTSSAAHISLRQQEGQTDMLSTGGYGDQVVQAMYGYRQQNNGYGNAVTQSMYGYTQPATVQAKAAGVSNQKTATPVTPSVPFQKLSEQATEEKEAIELPRGGMLQRKLTIGAPDDPYEQEADAMADQVMLKTEHAIKSDNTIKTSAPVVVIQMQEAYSDTAHEMAGHRVQEGESDGRTSVDPTFQTRNPEELDRLINDIVRAIALNESGGAEQATESTLRTAAGVPASYASSTQMVPAHAVTTLGRHVRYAQRFGLSQEQLRNADRIMHASQRIWDAIVKEGRNIHELSEYDLLLTGFTNEELTRMYHFGEFRRILLSNRDRYEQIKSDVIQYLNSQATIRLEQIQSLITDFSQIRSDVAQEPTTESESEPDVSVSARLQTLGEQAIVATPSRHLRSIEAILSFSLPHWWQRSRDVRRKNNWLEQQRRRIVSARRINVIERVSKKAAAALLSHEMIENEHVQAIGLREWDIQAYIHLGDFNRFNEDRQAWNRLALRNHYLQQTSGGSTESQKTLDEAISQATSSGGGWDLSQADFESFITDWLRSHPNASDEQVVRAAASHNGHSPDYPDRIWRNFQTIRDSETVTIETATP